MNIDSIKNGIVIDHITAGRGMEIYNHLHLGDLDCAVALIKNAQSRKMGRKDIIKIDEAIDLDLNVLGYVDPGVTVDVIRDGVLVEKKSIALPAELKNILFCKNPRCITSTEQELPHIFRLTDPEKRVYRCIYCETKAD
ncbi:MAG: aspartate carbamoyltransferase regulatory subunit [Lachnospiraceae bacterium]|nr:aspartate carbamoyltransferase regulatory subunit [Lachnospiraceae bacterium]